MSVSSSSIQLKFMTFVWNFDSFFFFGIAIVLFCFVFEILQIKPIYCKRMHDPCICKYIDELSRPINAHIVAAAAIANNG